MIGIASVSAERRWGLAPFSFALDQSSSSCRGGATQLSSVPTRSIARLDYRICAAYALILECISTESGT